MHLERMLSLGSHRTSRGTVGRKGYTGLELRREAWAGDGFGSCEDKGSNCSQGCMRAP